MLDMEEQIQVAAVRHNVVNLCRSHTVSAGGTLPAEWLAGQLGQPPPLPPIARIRVELVPGQGRFAFMPGLVIWAISIRRQPLASRVAAPPHRLIHAIPPETRKEASTTPLHWPLGLSHSRR